MTTDGPSGDIFERLQRAATSILRLGLVPSDFAISDRVLRDNEMAQIDGASVGTRLYEVSRLILSLPSSAPFHRFGSATRLADTLDQAFSALTPLHDYITAEGPLVSANHSTQSEFAQRLRTLVAYARGASDLYDALITDIRFSDPSSLGDAARLEVTGTLADVDSDVFSREADRQATLSFRWLSAGLAAVVVLVGLTFAFLAAPIGDEISDPETIQAITLKVFAAGTVSALAFLCFRMFRATQHQATINRHRDNALRAFRAFSSAAAEPSIRDAVLFEAAKAIFSPGASGVLDGREASQPTTTMMEVLRASSSRGGGADA